MEELKVEVPPQQLPARVRKRKRRRAQRSKSTGRLKVAIDMTFPKYLMFLDKSHCSQMEKMRAFDMYSKNEGKMRQDLIKCILRDQKNQLPQIEEVSVEDQSI